LEKILLGEFQQLYSAKVLVGEDPVASFFKLMGHHSASKIIHNQPEQKKEKSCKFTQSKETNLLASSP